MDELEKYIKKYPNEKMLIGQTVLGQWYVRPITWAGGWKDDKLFYGNCLSYFPTREDVENKLIELNYENS